MGSFASISLNVDLSRRSRALDVARDVLESFPGSRNATVDESGAATLEIHFPGNLTALSARLSEMLVPITGNVRVRVPIFNVASERATDANIVKNIDYGPEIWDVEFPRGTYAQDAAVNGDYVEATALPSTRAMHHLYDALLRIGLLASAGQPGYRGM